jgi:signal transduction histidine kinase
MFFLVSMVDADALNFHLSDVIIEALAGVSILLLFLTNFPLPIYINAILFAASNICMGIALIWQHKRSRDKFFIEDKLLKRIPKHKRYDTVHALKKELFQRAQSKCHLSLYFLFTFPLFPLLYYLRLFRFFDADTYFITMIAIKICSKAGFTHMLSMLNLEAFDPIKLVLIEQKRNHDHSRLAFIRYIVHELRGPLNSIALGLHVLTESSSSLVDTEDEIMGAIQEGTTCLSTCLSLSICLSVYACMPHAHSFDRSIV